jgi:hypothetical protein
LVLYNFLSGAAAFGFFVCSLFFLRFWARTRDQLILAFSLSFVLLGTGQAVVALAQMPTEEKGSLYLIRLLAFLLILVAIYRKNRPSRSI